MAETIENIKNAYTLTNVVNYGFAEIVQRINALCGTAFRYVSPDPFSLFTPCASEEIHSAISVFYCCCIFFRDSGKNLKFRPIILH